MDDNKDRFRYDGPSAQNAADDLLHIQQSMQELRDYFIGLTTSCCAPVAVTRDNLHGLAAAEEAVQILLTPQWNAAQDVLVNASSAELDEVDASCMGEPFPTFFSDRNGVISPEAFRALCARVNARRVRNRIPTNPATLIATGRADA